MGGNHALSRYSVSLYNLSHNQQENKIDVFFETVVNQTKKIFDGSVSREMFKCIQIRLFYASSITGRKNGFGPNLHLANLSKFGKKMQQTSSNDGKYRICYRFCTG